MGLRKPDTVVSGGVTLPELSNPATSDQILSGFEAITEDGQKVTGNHECVTAYSERDYTPYEMEEKTMLDLSNYTLNQNVTNSGVGNPAVSIAAGTYIILYTSETPATMEAEDNSISLPVSSSTPVKIKISATTRFILSMGNSQYLSFWKLNE